MLKYNDMEPKEFTPEDMKYIHDNDLIKKEYTDIEGEISINESSESIFDKILKLNDRLNDYEYMIPNNGNPITHIKNDDFIKYYVLLSPNEFEKYKGGVCWDYVAYEAMYFRAKYPNIKFETYYQVIDNRNDNPTHTFLIFEFNKKWYWFESSWKPNCGVYGFDNKNDCIEYIMQKLRLSGKNYGTYICKFDATDATMYGMNCVGYMNYMSFMIKPYKFTNKKIEPIFIYKGHCPDYKEYTTESDNNIYMTESEASSENLFHVSSVKLANTTLEPRIPDNFLVRNGYEDNITERISVCKSIDDCLTAMSRNLKNKDFYVYKLKNTNIKKKTPSVKEVPDSSITNEVWLLEPSEFELVGKIHVTGTKGDGLPYTYGDNTAELYRWKWSYVK